MRCSSTAGCWPTRPTTKPARAARCASPSWRSTRQRGATPKETPARRRRWPIRRPSSKNGVDGLVPVGTTGESPTLNFDEHIRVIKIVVEAAKKRVPVIAGTGSNATKEAIELSQEARKVGADGMLQVTPYYNRPTQDHLYRHFKAIIDAVPLPTVVYNVPGRTACDLLPETIARLAELSPIVGVKEATGSALRASQILARVGDRVALLSGDDATAFPLFALGARGCI